MAFGIPTAVVSATVVLVLGRGDDLGPGGHSPSVVSIHVVDDDVRGGGHAPHVSRRHLRGSVGVVRRAGDHEHGRAEDELSVGHTLRTGAFDDPSRAESEGLFRASGELSGLCCSEDRSKAS